MLVQIADLRLCALMSLHTYVVDRIPGWVKPKIGIYGFPFEVQH